MNVYCLTIRKILEILVRSYLLTFGGTVQRLTVELETPYRDMLDRLAGELEMASASEFIRRGVMLVRILIN
jgi:hypothetical protein